MQTIKLTQGKETIVDDEDFEYLSQWKWYFSHGYAIRTKYLGIINRKQKAERVYMHRIINDTSNGFDTDHINRNRLDNRPENLRTITHHQNCMNTGLSKNNTSGYKGVIYNKRKRKWQAYIRFNYKSIHLGYFGNIQGAWLARRWGERTYFEHS